VVNKPAGISVTADRTGEEDIVGLLSRQLESCSEIRLIHRLDKFASVFMILAKNRSMQSKLSSYFAKRLVKKQYLALVSGYVSEQEGMIAAPIGRSRRDPRKMCVDRRGGKEAVTRWRLLADFGGIAFLHVEPVTGRTHQIRVHLAHEQMPLAIDPLYGSSKALMLSDFKVNYRAKRDREESSLIDRLTLHAYEVRVPFGGGEVSYRAKPDKKFAAAIKMLAKHGPMGGRAFVKQGYLDTILAGGELNWSGW
jgi:RluA family pseudouridine synthase